MDFYEECDFNETVFVVNNGVIEEMSLADLCYESREETTTPLGVGSTFHIDGETLYRWTASGRKELVKEFDTEEEAAHSLLLTFKYDLENDCNAPVWFTTRNDAEKFLSCELF